MAIDVTRCHARVGPSGDDEPCTDKPSFLVQLREEAVMTCARHRPVRRKMVWPARADTDHLHYLTRVDGRIAVWRVRLTKGLADMTDLADPVAREDMPGLWAELEADVPFP